MRPALGTLSFRGRDSHRGAGLAGWTGPGAGPPLTHSDGPHGTTGLQVWVDMSLA